MRCPFRASAGSVPRMTGTDGVRAFESTRAALELLPDAIRRLRIIAAIERQKMLSTTVADEKALDARIAERLEWFGDHAIVVREIDRGLLDFPVAANGRIVMLCWSDGEDTFRAWHEIDGGYVNRYPLWTLEGT